MRADLKHSENPLDLAERVDWFDDAARAVLARRRVPRATYRLQFTSEFTFEDARRILPYLERLGVSDVYASPLLKPCAGSSHGYDICDHHQLNPALGSPADFNRFVAELRRRGMGLVFDVVPNHMGITDPANVWWMDVLEDGPSSPYAAFFDIDWHPMKVEADLENKVLLPILGESYGASLTRGEIALGYDDGAFFVHYYDRRFPVNPRSYAEILGRRLDEVVGQLGEDDPDVQELQSIITAINHLPPETEIHPELIAERQREKGVIKRRIGQLATASPAVRAAIEATVAEYNGEPGNPHSFDLLDHLLAAQSYRLAFWRVAAEEINYRRFFDINNLAAIRMERPEVFAETHRLILRLVAEGKVTGLRIDHADGLWDPVGYLRTLQRAAFLAGDWLDRRFGGEGPDRAAAEADLLARYDEEVEADPNGALSRPIYVVVEKILGARELLPEGWPVDGTTGYDFANQLNGLFVDARSQRALTELYAAFTRARPPAFGDLVNSTKKMIMLVSLASEINELAYQLKRLANASRWYRDLTLNGLTFALREVIASLPIYRTYVTEAGAVDEHDRAAIEASIADARRRNPRTAATVFDFIRAVLLQEYPEDLTDEARAQWTSFVMRFQQITSPVVAKGIEDTAFYRYNLLLSLNEVGGDPEKFGTAPATFHRLNQARLRHWPHTMLAGSTHDSKRSADVRARLNVLSEIPTTFRRALTTWGRQNRSKKTVVQGAPAPDRNDEYLLYQTLLGAWPLGPLDRAGLDHFRQRIKEYLQKALKEAKVHTSWVNPNQAYDDAVARFVDLILGGSTEEGFLASFRPIQQLVAFHGMLNSLSQTLLQLTAPGVPDLYQGSEIWDLTLVDPDNRRPVDFARRQRLLDGLVAAAVPKAVAVAAAGGHRHLPPGPAQRAPRPGKGAQRAPRVETRLQPPDPTLAGVPFGPGQEPVHQRSDADDGRFGAAQPNLSDLRENWPDGRIKLHVVRTTLEARRAYPEVFGEGRYLPVELSGPAREHAFGFVRSADDTALLSLVPRFTAELTEERQVFPLGEDIWGTTVAELPEGFSGGWCNRLTGEVIHAVEQEGRVALPLAEVFRTFPVALLEKI